MKAVGHELNVFEQSRVRDKNLIDNLVAAIGAQSMLTGW